jgi:hypothetical protein
MSWRDSIKIHPAADLFPMLGDDDLVALGEDIKDKGGLIHPVAIQVNDDVPVFLDGRNRLDAMERIGWRVQIKQGKGTRGRPGEWYLLIEGHDGSGCPEGYPAETMDYRNAVFVVDSDIDPVEYVASVNIHRRHLTAEQKREVIAKLLKENPERSNRATAALVKVDDKTVGSVRREMEARAEIPHVEKTVDTKGRLQPTNKQRSAPASAPYDPVQAQEIIEQAEAIADTDCDDDVEDEDDGLSPKERAEQTRGAFLIRADYARDYAYYDGKADAEIIEFAKAAADAWCDLAARMEGISSFKSATQAIGQIKSYAEFCRTNSPATVAAGLLPHEVEKVRNGIAVIDAWLARFVTLLPDEPKSTHAAPAPTVEPSTEATTPPTVPEPKPITTGEMPDIPPFLDLRPGAANGAAA